MISRVVGSHGPRGMRLLLSAAAGIATALAAAGSLGQPDAAVLGWLVAGGLYCAWTWAVIGRMSSRETRSHATKEDSTRVVADLVLLVGSVGSLAGVAVLLLGAQQSKDGGVPWEAVLGVACVAVSWLVVHTVFLLRYAALYYAGKPGGIDFNQDADPDYHDFAYVAFTLGMTYQVSDTSISSSEIRRAVLRQSLLAYLLGSVILATTINLVVQLASGGGSSS